MLAPERMPALREPKSAVTKAHRHHTEVQTALLFDEAVRDKQFHQARRFFVAADALTVIVPCPVGQYGATNPTAVGALADDARGLLVRTQP